MLQKASPERAEQFHSSPPMSAAWHNEKRLINLAMTSTAELPPFKSACAWNQASGHQDYPCLNDVNHLVQVTLTNKQVLNKASITQSLFFSGDPLFLPRPLSSCDVPNNLVFLVCAPDGESFTAHSSPQVTP